jgi:AcrR family transcriptional regulator
MWEFMASRAELKEQKKKISNALINAAIELCDEDGYASLSIRSVARKAGIAPTSFYRHFRDIDELGVAIVEKANIVLTNCFQEIRKKISEHCGEQISPSEQFVQSIECVVRPFVETFIACMKQNNQLLCLFFQERTGNSEQMRKAISEDINNLIHTLSQDLKRLHQDISKDIFDISLIAESMIAIASYDSVAMLLDSPNESQQMSEKLIKKLYLLLLGAIK